MVDRPCPLPSHAQRRGAKRAGWLPLAFGCAIILASLVYYVSLRFVSSNSGGLATSRKVIAPAELRLPSAKSYAEHVSFLSQTNGASRGQRGRRLTPLFLSASASAGVLSDKRFKKFRPICCACIGLAIGLLVLALPDSASFAVKSSVADPTSVTSAFKTSFVRAFHSGKGGFLAGACQVVAFMWLRTTMNYQYKNGGAFIPTLRLLWAEGGMRRLYHGLFPWAILQAPLSRFGDTAANELVLGLRSAAFPSIPLPFATAFGSFCGAAWRVIITPVDTCKTTLQTDGAKGWKVMKQKVTKGGVRVLWYGWEGNYLANVVGGYPFFFTYNQLSHVLPQVDRMWLGLVRYAAIGAVSATISDITSNAIRVMKTKKQTSDDPNMGYFQAAGEVIASDGVCGLMLRGLGTRIIVNTLQGALFTVLWRGIFSRD